MLDHDPNDSDFASSPPPKKLSIKISRPSSSMPQASTSQNQYGNNNGDIWQDEDDYGHGMEEEEEEEANGSGFDSDLADEINKGLEALNAPNAAPANNVGSSEDEGGLFGSSDEDDEEEEEIDPEEEERRRKRKLLGEEVGDLDRAIASKMVELGKAMNPIFKVSPFHFTGVCTLSNREDRNDSKTRSRSSLSIETPRK